MSPTQRLQKKKSSKIQTLKAQAAAARRQTGELKTAAQAAKAELKKARDAYKTAKRRAKDARKTLKGLERKLKRFGSSTEASAT